MAHIIRSTLPSLAFQAPRRRGIVLLIVMAMLALFAVVGLSFVFYADAQFIASQHHRQSFAVDLSDLPPEKLLNFFLGQQIFGSSDQYSSVRGHDFATSLYGIPGGTTPFSGIGRFMTDSTDSQAKDSMGNARSLTTKMSFINFTHFPTLQGATQRDPQDGTNVPYTFPDNNNVFLARIDGNGQILARSYDRNSNVVEFNDTDVSKYSEHLYLTTRPIRVYHTNFPKLPGVKNSNGYWEGDVRNVDGLKGLQSDSSNFLNDSFWIDAGFPVMVAKDGTKYKPLFATFILDLDSRVNLSVAADYLADYNTDNTSMNGMGAYEINPVKVGLEKEEISYLWNGQSSGAATLAPGRYGNDKRPEQYDKVDLPRTPYYSKLPYKGTATENIKMATATSLSMFPAYHSDWADCPSGTPNPNGYNPLKTPRGDGYSKPDDSPFHPAHSEVLLRFGEPGTQSLTSYLVRGMPKSFDMSDANKGQKNRHFVTVVSTALDVPHLAPFFIGDPTAKYKLEGTNSFPKTDLTAREQKLPTTPSSFTGAGEFSASYQSRLAALRRLNLQRNLTDYPTDITNKQAMEDAHTARQKFAKDIFDLLVKVTGAKADVSNDMDTDAEYKATRWLAQLAVNIVDYIDKDDYMTLFNWNTKSDGTYQYVCGCEMPRALINEAYSSYDNDKTDTGINQTDETMSDPKYQRLNTWVELCNPMTDKKTELNKDRTRYRLVIVNKAPAAGDEGFGKPSDIFKDVGGQECIVDSWGGTGKIDEVSTSTTGNTNVISGFYVLGATTDPFYDDAGKMAELKPDIKRTDPANVNNTKAIDFETDKMSAKLEYDKDKRDTPIFILQRLANPDLDESDDATDQTKREPKKYNPWVTVDIFNGATPNNGVKYESKKNSATIGMQGTVAKFKSYGRQQPMKDTDPKEQKPDPAETDKTPQHTFGRHNCEKATMPAAGTLELPFVWQPHLDRPLGSLPELIQVLTIAPNQVTKNYPFNQDTAGANGRHLFYDALVSDDSLLWRFFELVTAPDQRPMSTAGIFPIQSPGKVNITTAPKKVFEAVADERSGVSNFTGTDVDNLYNALYSSSRGKAGMSDYELKTSGSGDVVALKPSPFTSLVPTPTGAGGKWNSSDLFTKSELARKIHKNTTFTSNAFAVWVTVGFFKVEDDSVTPAKLGEEIGKSENRHVRHRMFAIVDRSMMVLPDYAKYKVSKDVTKGTNVTVEFTTGDPAPTNLAVKVKENWTPRKGLQFVFDRGGANEESAELTYVDSSVSPAKYYFNLTKDHPAGEKIYLDGYYSPSDADPTKLRQSPWQNTMLAHPGPQPEFNVRDYSYIVPFFTVID